ncbi:hypothetical protein ACOQFV_32070 [Nocardiopsis changdeensis]|uniref:Uncharacterized protein n=1 Tax=Nocardiopsis changdeensis TaxID=2831969 RepID=A0ABX8BS10_9ACTN|nr:MULTISPECIES: hypothetical protein [Nocardiopsis]QUX24879.1 hypothetical protein KGD84_11785 [Nocardiopsis changdeensis]QYX35265.1 hypothetical protein K1J57_21230 [Nocardiopsis sp. MT53]
MATEIKVRVDPGGRALLALGRSGYRLRTFARPSRWERVPAVLGTASLILFGVGWIPLIWLQATGGEPTGLHLAPVGIGLAGLLITGLAFAWRELAGELLGYLTVFLLVTLFPLYFPLLLIPAVRRRVGAALPSGDGDGEKPRRRRTVEEGGRSYSYAGLAGARLSDEGHRATLVLENRDGSTLECGAAGADAHLLRTAARERLGALLEEGSGDAPRV